MERDYPIGHPAASDYNGEEYTPPRAPFGQDYPENHPAFQGSNISDLDRPDGFRAAHTAQTQDLVELASVGSLPKLIDNAKDRVIELEPATLAKLYALRYGLVDEVQREDFSAAVAAELLDKGYSADRARELMESYFVMASEK